MKNLTDKELNLLYDWSNGSPWCMTEQELKQLRWFGELEKKKVKYNFLSDVSELYEYGYPEKWGVDLDLLLQKINALNEEEYHALLEKIENFWRRKTPCFNLN